eukprot:4439606-Prymnesium_polylepis.2
MALHHGRVAIVHAVAHHEEAAVGRLNAGVRVRLHRTKRVALRPEHGWSRHGRRHGSRPYGRERDQEKRVDGAADHEARRFLNWSRGLSGLTHTHTACSPAHLCVTHGYAVRYRLSWPSET